MKLAIVQQPAPILHEKAMPIKKILPEYLELAQNMVETMYAFNGVGLAAPQVGYPLRLIVFDASTERDQPSVLINPEIKSHSKTTVEKVEGCLSCKGFDGMVIRFEKITATGWNMNGKKVTFKADGLLARVIQHEIDHLNGITITDIGRPLTLAEKAELEKDASDEVVS